MPFNLGHAVRKLRLRHFELLAQMDSERTLRAAAGKMALTQPAVSKMLREIEDCFGAKLFERTHTGVSPNRIGATLVQHAVALLNELRVAGEDVNEISKGAPATLRIGTFSVIPCVPRAIAKMRARLPGVIVRIREGTGVTLLRALRDGEVHCVVGALPPEILRSAETESLFIDPIGHDRLCVMASPDHRLAKERRLIWQDLVDERWVLPPRESLLRRGIVDAYLQAGLPQPSPVVEMLSPISLATLVSNDKTLLGVMRLEQAMAEQATDRLRILPLTPRINLPPLAFITHRKLGDLPESARVFQELLHKSMHHAQ
jgi:DNA-binding transcriptional LysR family regulator